VSTPESWADLDDPLDPDRQVDHPVQSTDAEDRLTALEEQPLPEFGDEQAEGLIKHSDNVLNSVGLGLIHVNGLVGSPPNQTRCQALVDCGASSNYIDEELLRRADVMSRTHSPRRICLPQSSCPPPKYQTNKWQQWCKDNNACFNCAAKGHSRSGCPQPPDYGTGGGSRGRGSQRGQGRDNSAGTSRETVRQCAEGRLNATSTSTTPPDQDADQGN
ncbi:hypothetical protein KEM55_006179, partial [Ascosphaera atra]